MADPSLRPSRRNLGSHRLRVSRNSNPETAQASELGPPGCTASISGSLGLRWEDTVDVAQLLSALDSTFCTFPELGEICE